MLHIDEIDNYKLENAGLEIIKNNFPGIITVIGSSEDYNLGIDAYYDNKTIDFKFNKDRENGVLSIYRTQHSTGIYYSPFPSKSDEIWFCILKPNGLLIYKITKRHQYNIISDLELLKIKKLNQGLVTQVVVFFPLIDRYSELFKYIRG